MKQHGHLRSMRRDFSPVLGKLLKLCFDLHQQTKLPAGMSLLDAPQLSDVCTSIGTVTSALPRGLGPLSVRQTRTAFVLMGHFLKWKCE